MTPIVMNMTNRLNHTDNCAIHPLRAVSGQQSFISICSTIVNLLILQGANLRQEEADDNEQQRTNSIAQFELRYLRDVLAEQNDDLAKEEKQSEGLEKIKSMASGFAPGPEG